ncbi:MAG TPA: CBS domain-containing protein, partial [Candidatus Altiarchaeales archaeon]|nr:CBS domain-containing protein [Candidatus Altiarchaeales archaeon]
MARTLEIFTMGNIHWDERVSDYMSKNLITIDEDATMYDAVQMMLDNKIHGLLVTDDDKLKGIVTSYDVLLIMEKGKSSKNTRVKEAMSSDIIYVNPEDKIIIAVNKMLEND